MSFHETNTNMKAVLCVLLLWSLAASEPIRYDRHKVVRVIPRTKEQTDVLKAMQQQYLGHDQGIAEIGKILPIDSLISITVQQVDFWTYPRHLGSPVDIRLSPDIFGQLVGAFTVYGLHPRVIISDVQVMMDRQRFVPKNPLLHLEEIDYGQYHKLDEIVDWMENLTTTYPDKVTEIDIGKSYEGRSIKGLKISTGQSNEAFWMEGGIHAREWISPATVIYMTGQMLDNYDSDTAMKELVDSYEWYILPVFNVDGYEYTWTNDRMWRKTRSEGGLCHGVDPNRNWDDHWCEEGASRNQCSETYCGPSAVSEIEVKSVADYIETIPNLKVFIDFHSYSQLWMTPWGYTNSLPEDYAAQENGAKAAVEALKSVHGTEYVTGNIARVIYLASGSSADWAYDKAKVKYSYAVELRDTGMHGFLLPADQIIPSGEETLKAVEALAKYVKNNP